METVTDTETVAPVLPAPEVMQTPLTSGPAPGTQAHLVATVGDRVFFEYDRAELTPTARDILRRQAEWLRNNLDVSVVIEGHCDERGTREYNIALGERRATAARNYMIALGISGDRMRKISYGKERPVAFGATQSAWSKNRRAVLVVL
ncbi:MAG: peptidoglycan-associated lipoprotein Pal [Alphaproteobacteria bacterium]